MATTILNITWQDLYQVSQLGIVDISVYAPGFTISNPTLEITPPGYSKIVVPFAPQSINAYQANDLGIICSVGTALPDGIYKLTYSVAPNTIYTTTKEFMRVEAIKCLYAQKFLTIDNCCGCTEKTLLKQQLREVEMLIQGCISDGNQCDVVNANKKYQAAHRLLARIGDCACQ